IAAVVDDGTTEVGIESTVVDCTGEVPVVLRLGDVSADAIKQVVGAVRFAGKLEAEMDEDPALSPGLKYPQYAPEIPLYLVKNKTNVASLVHSEQKQGKRVGLILSTLAEDSIQAEKVVSLGKSKQEMANRLYKLLRSFRKEEVDLVICEAP